jgi:hypothetical protein
VFVSFDDGGHWQPFQLNLPHCSVRDLAFAGNDLVVGTHGRAFWILDDLSPLRQAAPLGTGLFQPSAAVAYIRGPGFDDGTPLPMEEPRCENPPDGAIIDYYLAAHASLVELIISDSKGKEVAKYSSADKPEQPDLYKLTITPNWVRARPPLSAESGAHRGVWTFNDHTAPGAYTVTLRVDGQSYRATVRVLQDPREPHK